MVQIYYGNGKGKTTAAAGLALRAAARNWQVLFVQFLKDGTSGEIQVLRSLPDVAVATQQGKYPFFSQMTEEQKRQAGEEYRQLLERGHTFLQEAEKADKGAGNVTGRLLVMDEVLHALRYGLIEEKEVLDLLSYSSPKVEIVLTGYDPSEEILARADYITEMRKVRHPFDCGLVSRRGIEE